MKNCVRIAEVLNYGGGAQESDQDDGIHEQKGYKLRVRELLESMKSLNLDIRCTFKSEIYNIINTNKDRVSKNKQQLLSRK